VWPIFFSRNPHKKSTANLRALKKTQWRGVPAFQWYKSQARIFSSFREKWSLTFGFFEKAKKCRRSLGLNKKNYEQLSGVYQIKSTFFMALTLNKYEKMQIAIFDFQSLTLNWSLGLLSTKLIFEGRCAVKPCILNSHIKYVFRHTRWFYFKKLQTFFQRNVSLFLGNWLRHILIKAILAIFAHFNFAFFSYKNRIAWQTKKINITHWAFL